MATSIDQSVARNVTSPTTLNIIELSDDDEDNVIDLTSSQSDTEREDVSRQVDSARRSDARKSDEGTHETRNLTDKRNPPILFDAQKLSKPSLKTPVSIEPLYVDDESEPENRMGNDDDDAILVFRDESKSARKPIAISPIPTDRKGADDVTTLKQCLPRRKSRKADSAREREKRERYAEELFSELNEKVFKSGLPRETKLTWNKRLLTTAGRANWRRNKEGLHYAEIELSEKILDCKERIRNTLSHEMCHLATWIIDADPKQAHGRLWKRWASKVMKKRPEIEITTRHNYEISYPYQWKCQKCAKIYGRFSKSIRPDECVCGACKEGRLVPLFTTPQTSQGTSTGNEMAAVEPKAPPSNAITPSGDDGVIDSESEVELLLMTLRNVTLQ